MELLLIAVGVPIAFWIFGQIAQTRREGRAAAARREVERRFERESGRKMTEEDWDEFDKHVSHKVLRVLGRR